MITRAHRRRVLAQKASSPQPNRLFVAVIFPVASREVVDGVVQSQSHDGDGSFKSFVGVSRVHAIERAMAAKSEFESKRFSARYRVLVGELNQEAVTPVTKYELVSL